MKSITLEEIVKTIKEVIPELSNVPVSFDDKNAKYIGPYFGLSEDVVYKIYPEEELDNPMFDINDFLEQEHVSYYQVGLPNEEDIILMKKDVMQEYFEYIWNQQNFSFVLNDLTKKIFIILHEFGHAHELYVKYDLNLFDFISIRNYREKISCDSLENMLKYKDLEIEKYADNIVFNYIEKVFFKLMNFD